MLGAVALAAGGVGVAAAEPASDPGMVARGRYLAKAADCMPCHTAASGKPFAGGLKMNTPFGAMYSPNITPDRDTGIGAWTFDEFKRAVHSGIRADGKYLYPAMPFDAFTGISEDDLTALWAYFRSVPPVKQQQSRERAELSVQHPLRHAGVARRCSSASNGSCPSRAKSAQSKSRRLSGRGARPLRRLPHAAQLHGCDQGEPAVRGCAIDQWYAPDITTEALVKTNGWDKSQLIAFLKNGAANNSTALGPMQEVVHDSPFVPDAGRPRRHGQLPARSERREGRAGVVAQKLSPKAETLAAKLYADNCASCHGAPR